MMSNNLTSTYRSELMAFAILAILLTHINCDFGIFFINRLALCGQGGVDAFFYLSGFGLYYSANKGTTLGNFYRKRAIRIFPPFLTIFILYMCAKHNFTWERLVWGGSTLAFWFPATRKYMFGWFVSTIIVLYAIFPFYYKCFKRHKHLATLCAICLGLTLTSIYAYWFLVLHPSGYNQYILAAARIPIFFIGVYTAWYLNNATPSIATRKRQRALAIGIAIIAFTLYNVDIDKWGFMNMRNSGMLYLPFTVIVPGVCVMLGRLFEIANRFSIGKFLLAILREIGSCTLEAYLLIGITYGYSRRLSQWWNINELWSKLCLAAFTLVLAWIIHKVITYVVKRICHAKKTYPYSIQI